MTYKIDTEAYPLPEGVEDAVLSKERLAEAFGVSLPTIANWQRSGLPVQTEGDNGRAYEFLLSECYAWNEARKAAKADADERADRAVQQMRLHLVGGGLGDEERVLSPRERGDLYSAELAFNKAAQARGELVPRSDLVETLERVFALIVRFNETLPDRLQRECGLTNSQVEAAIRACDQALVDLNGEIGAILPVSPAPAARERTLA